ncbi:uncharacterized protein [Chironomus tepperi]|uniref:uncharacterized protein n=1 Tax=Chironomus tepperi TaxID=113505 RepID=UPI00391F2AA4
MKIQIIFVAVLVNFAAGLDIPANFCTDMPNGIYPHPGTCLQFVFCMDGNGTVNDCPYPNIIFYDGYCVAGDPESCTVFTTTTPTATSTTTTMTSTTTTLRPLPDDFCTGIVYDILPHPFNCTNYVICLYGSPTINNCQHPTPIFHDVIQSCVAGNTETCEIFTDTTTTFRTTSTTMTTTSTTMTTTETPFPDKFCTNKSNGVYPHPDNCLQFVFCMNGNGVVNYCQYPTLLFYNGYCVAGDPETCEVFSSTTSKPTTTTTEYKSTSTSRLPATTSIPVHRCPPSGFGLIPHYTNCSRYFECIAGIRHLRFCPYGLLFDSVTLRCTYPELAVCAGGQ